MLWRTQKETNNILLEIEEKGILWYISRKFGRVVFCSYRENRTYKSGNWIFSWTNSHAMCREYELFSSCFYNKM